MLLLASLIGAAEPRDVIPEQPLLAIDPTVVAGATGMMPIMHPPIKMEQIIQPTEPWESYAVFAYNTLLIVGDGNYRSLSKTPHPKKRKKEKEKKRKKGKKEKEKNEKRKRTKNKKEKRKKRKKKGK